jgi:hypothetical protein
MYTELLCWVRDSDVAEQFGGTEDDVDVRPPHTDWLDGRTL